MAPGLSTEKERSDRPYEDGFCNGNNVVKVRVPGRHNGMTSAVTRVEGTTRRFRDVGVQGRCRRRSTRGVKWDGLGCVWSRPQRRTQERHRRDGDVQDE